MNKPITQTWSTAFLLNMRMLQQKIPVEDLVVRTSFPSKKQLIVFTAYVSHTWFFYGFATRFMNRCDMEREKCITGIFFSRNQHVSVEMDLVDTLLFQNMISDIMFTMCLSFRSDYCDLFVQKESTGETGFFRSSNELSYTQKSILLFCYLFRVQ